jgi:hypothetical protein
MLANDDTSLVDVLSLETFRSTLDGRLSEANAVRTSMVEILRRSAPRLGDLADAHDVGRRYQYLYDQYLDRVDKLIRALVATQTALTTIIDNYQTNEDRLTADASDIADALGGSGGAYEGGETCDS